MRLLTCLVLAFSFVPLMAFAQQKPATESAPFVVEQTYWIKPGKELQFIELFEKNRVPMLRARVKEGHILWMRLSKPQFNAVNEQWDLRLTVAWRSTDNAMDRIALAKTQMAKDSQRMSMEQQIMDELILARTEVPVQEWSVGDSDP